ncbi:aldose epimerase family protein [Paracoccus sp. (in: a-proteobacteria)]|uniref:aldose epimerase family protein n=1 Tax=Paracoccus sp. TaxID=267 RepID=UPI0028A0F218|nr:aldose epimerase family protein [Paracoccus sp. (in: a-proteobacteria)]
MSISTFGTLPDGQPALRAVISAHGLTASIVSFGARLQDLRLDGVAHPLVLGFDTLEPYLTEGKHFGAIAGRFANRIANGRAKIGGQDCQLDVNFLDKHLLHGGHEGTSTRNWTFTEQTSDSVTLTCDLAAGHMGFPGHLHIALTYKILPGPTLKLAFEAQTDAETLCNLAQHSYFNLDGSADITGHRLQIAAPEYTPVDAEMIPTGEIAPVDGTIFDFREGRLLNDPRVLSVLDHNFCIARNHQPMPVLAARLSAGGITLDILSTEPGLQVYAGANLHPRATGLNGHPYGANAGIAMESQLWPDAPNHPNFPSALLLPGETYRQDTLLAFSRD